MPTFTDAVAPDARPQYQVIAEDLVRRLTRDRPPRLLPADSEIAVRYGIPLFTAQFVRRAALTRLRPPTAALPVEMAELMPLWQKVANSLRTRIVRGQLAGRLPNRFALADEYGVSTDTVSRAVRALQDDGLVINSGCRGTHVAPVPRPAAQEGRVPPP